KMPGMDGMELHHRIREIDKDAVVIMITAYGAVDTAVKALKDGAFDYITKPFDPDNLSHLLRNAAQQRKLTMENIGLKGSLEALTEPPVIIGVSKHMDEIKNLISTVAKTTTTVMIRGESGTGKELVAQAIHAESDRRFFPIVTVNCGALSETLLESELFGHEKGTFTGAYERKLGKLESAKNGSIFFDEIGELSPNLQQKLLRVLQEREFERLGSNTLQKVKARFIFATNKNLQKEVSAGRFREDLWFRINVLSIKIPPLRERKDDIPLLLKYFLKRFNFELGKSVTEVPDDVLKFLIDYDYPGNVRELSNLIERGIILSKDQTFSLYSLPDIVLHNEKSPDLDFAITNSTNATTYIKDMSIAAWVKPNYSKGSPEFTVVSKAKS
ncbi:MAG: sigma-54-dependent Fis family transcriptional regulator, partial [Candidatus Heimdallarchaeota archaeon]|nr:sigma-54-dependent Fis family transcriptional regulator [Candidatus Heimdallarchaeota archaeon]